jgi:hypothetical protein
MTPRKKAATAKRTTKKLKLKKETLKDLDARASAGDVKGGRRALGPTIGNDWDCTKGCTVGNCW